jgi:hypothetical protein
VGTLVSWSAWGKFVAGSLKDTTTSSEGEVPLDIGAGTSRAMTRSVDPTGMA